MKRQRLEGAAAATGRGLHRDAENPLPHKAPGSGNPLSDGRGDTGVRLRVMPLDVGTTLPGHIQFAND